ncbi:DUF1403 family protein [Beijerinckia mobilis]|uniref:DUF1403 family protein n=1 Tax=Beijerinckia mobilis TaxID=231434 RepID=UPI0005506C70|nr:DUF1403 family protein [Beijerinckia mobilis]
MALSDDFPPPPPACPVVPAWARGANAPETPLEVGVCAGAALAVLDPIARTTHPLGQLLRRRLALAQAARLARLVGRAEGESQLRDAWVLRRAGDDPGPAGRVLGLWRALGEPSALPDAGWTERVARLFDLEGDVRLEAIVSMALKQGAGEGAAMAAAIAIVAASLRLLPDNILLALWLADAGLAAHLHWPAPVPLLASQIRPAELKDITRSGKSGDAWLIACGQAYARAAAAAVDLYAELVPRAHRLLTVAPQLRGKDAAHHVRLLLSEDALAAAAGPQGSDRSARRLFDRLVAEGVLRELTGRAAFRLYGL